MAGDYRGRRPAERPSNVLPTTVGRQKPPEWPLGAASKDETALWADLWRRPVAHLWRQTYTPTIVVARYVRVVIETPGSGSLAQMENGLGLTPASLARLKVTFEEPRPTLSGAAEDVLAAARARRAS
jgi:hypothetical protein